MCGLVYVVLAVSLLTTRFDASDLKHCKPENSKTSIEACTRIIDAPDADAKTKFAAYSRRGSAYVKAKNLTSALEDFSDIVRLRPTDAEAYIRRGHVYSALHEFDEAIADYESALRLRPRVEGALTGLGLAYLGMGLHDRAIGAFDKVLRISPDNAKTLARRAFAYLAIGMPELGFDDIQRAARLQPHDVGIQRLYKTFSERLNLPTLGPQSTGE